MPGKCQSCVDLKEEIEAGEAEYVRLYNVANPTTEFAMTLCKLWLDAIGTPKEEHWFNAYDLYMDRVILNPNI